MALACDRTYVLNDPDMPVFMGISAANGGPFPMSNGITRLQTRFLADSEQPARILESAGILDADTADQLGLATSRRTTSTGRTSCASPSRSALPSLPTP